MGEICMAAKELKDYSINDVPALILDNVDSVIVVDSKTDSYRALKRNGIFENYIEEAGTYHDLIVKLWFHIDETNAEVTEDYHVFIDSTGKFTGKYSRRIKIHLEGSEKPSIAQMTVYPFENNEYYLFILDELNEEEVVQEVETTKKISTIQNSYLFSMYIDLAQDTTSSINITEISDNVVNSQLKYSEWRMMIVNMFMPEDQEQFLRRTDPEYLKKNFTPGKTSSYDCLMRNLEGKYIWVKLIFSRAQTFVDDDYRFVFMVQDIDENSQETLSALKKYEEMAIKDPLTKVFNHGEIETQMHNALTGLQKNNEKASVMMVDLDLFKNVNDTYGHSTGDTTLKLFAGMLKEMAAANNSLAGRWGGEEFVVVCLGMNVNEVLETAEKFRKDVETYEFPEIGHITCSIGVTELKTEDTFDEAFDRLDKAMYKSKHNGRNQVTIL